MIVIVISTEGLRKVLMSLQYSTGKLLQYPRDIFRMPFDDIDIG